MLEAVLPTLFQLLSGKGTYTVPGYSTLNAVYGVNCVDIDMNTPGIAVAGLTGNDKDDTATAKTMLRGATGRIRSFHGDGACDDPDFRKVPESRGTSNQSSFRDAVIRKETKKNPLEAYPHQRNQAVDIHQNGRKAWKVEQKPVLYFLPALYFFTSSINVPNIYSVSVAPPDASGWNCAEKKGLVL